jgi:hypothetical protein
VSPFCEPQCYNDYFIEDMKKFRRMIPRCESVVPNYTYSGLRSTLTPCNPEEGKLITLDDDDVPNTDSGGVTNDGDQPTGRIWNRVRRRTRIDG